jgi:hypothetical protein
MPVYRAGGHIDRGDGKGWVPDDTQPEPAPEPVPHQPLSPTMEAAGGWQLVGEPPPPSPEPEPEPEPEPDVEPEAEAEEPEPPSDAEVRAWAKEVGIDVPARGRLSKDVIDQYVNREREN